MKWVGHVAGMGRGELNTGFWCGNLTEGDHLQDPGIGERIILKWIFRKWDGDMDFIDPVQNRNRLRAHVNSVMNLRVP